MQTCAICGIAVSGSDVMYTADGRIVCPKCFANAAPVAVSSGPWRGLAIAGAVIGAVPFGLRMATVSSSSVNGEITSFVYRDWVAVICGVVAIGLGIATVLAGRKATLQRGLAIGAGIGVLALGGLQVARGFGVFETPSMAGNSTSITISGGAPTSTPAKPVVDPKHPETCPDQDSCWELGRSLEDGKQLDQAAIAYGRACDEKAKGGCFNAGFLLSHRDAPDWVKAISYFQKGCDLGHLLSCNEAALGYKLGRGVTKDIDRARKMFDKGCGEGDALCCLNLANFYAAGLGVEKNLERAYQLDVKACDLKEPDAMGACDDAGEALYTGAAGKKDLAAAAAYFEKACQVRPAHCYNLAVVTEGGEGVPKDPARARELYEKACGAGTAKACFNLGVVYAHGEGVKKDPGKARELYAKACTGGMPDACNNLGRYLADGLGGPKDPARARELFQKACDAGDQMGCKNLQK